jgi:hypothetical protein
MAEKRLDIILSAKDVGVAKAFTQIGNQAVSIQKQVNAAAVQFTQAASGAVMSSSGAAVSFGRRGGLNVGAGNALGAIRSVEAEAKASADRLEQQARDRLARRLREERRAARELAGLNAFVNGSSLSPMDNGFNGGGYFGGPSPSARAGGSGGAGGGSRGGLFGRFADKTLGSGLGAKAFGIGAAGIAISAAANASDSLVDTYIEIADGTKKWDEALSEIPGKLPLIGGFFSAFKKLVDRADTSRQLLEAMDREADSRAAAKAVKHELQNRADELASQILGGATDFAIRSTFRDNPAELAKYEIQQQYKPQRDAIEKAIKEFQDRPDTIVDDVSMQRLASLRNARDEIDRRVKVEQDAIDGKTFEKDTARNARRLALLNEAEEKTRKAMHDSRQQQLRDDGEFLKADLEAITESYDQRLRETEKYYDDLANQIRENGGTNDDWRRIMELRSGATAAVGRQFGVESSARIAGEQSAMFDALGQAMFGVMSGRGMGSESLITANSRTASLQSERFASGDGDLIATRTYEIQKKTADNTKVTAEAAKKTAELMNKFVNDSITGQVFVWGGASNN